MIDLKKVKEDIAGYKENIKNRNLSLDFDEFLALESQKNELSMKLDELRNIKNTVSKEIPTLSEGERAGKIAEMKTLGEQITQGEEMLKPIEEKYTYILHRLPNFLDPTATVGLTDEDGVAEIFF